MHARTRKHARGKTHGIGKWLAISPHHLQAGDSEQLSQDDTGHESVANSAAKS